MHTAAVAVMIVSVLQHDNGNLLCVMAKAKKKNPYLTRQDDEEQIHIYSHGMGCLMQQRKEGLQT